MKVHRIDHVGVIVKDLSAAKAFFLDLGLEVLGETDMGAKWAEPIFGFRDVKQTLVMLGMPDGQATLELIKFHTPSDEKIIHQSYANSLGIQHIAFAVEDIEAIVANLKNNGAELVDGIQNYENAYKLCFVRGPEGIIVELSEKIN